MLYLTVSWSVVFIIITNGYSGQRSQVGTITEASMIPSVDIMNTLASVYIRTAMARSVLYLYKHRSAASHDEASEQKLVEFQFQIQA